MKVIIADKRGNELAVLYKCKKCGHKISQSNEQQHDGFCCACFWFVNGPRTVLKSSNREACLALLQKSAKEQNTNLQTALVDVFTDLMHVAAAQKLNFESAYGSAVFHFLAETMQCTPNKTRAYSKRLKLRSRS